MQFAADVFDELGTALLGAVAFFDELEERLDIHLAGVEAEAVARSLVGNACAFLGREEADRLSTLVDRLLTLSRVSAAASVRPEAMDLGVLADEVATHLRVLADERQQQITVRQEGRAACIADRVLLRQALANLVDNALKYSAEGSTVELAVRAADGLDGLHLDVIDEGPGIPPEQQERIFDRFARGTQHDERRGHGLGLAIAKAATEANGGTLAIVPTARGTCFRMTIPRPADTSEAPSVAKPVTSTKPLASPAHS